MKVAQVWVNENKLPTKQQLISQALVSLKYKHFTKPEAIKLIEKEIKKSGLKFKDELSNKTKAKPTKSDKEPTKDSSGHSDNKQSKSNKPSKK